MPSTERQRARVAEIARQFYSYLESRNLNQTTPRTQLERVFQTFITEESIDRPKSFGQVINFLIHRSRSYYIIYKVDNLVVFDIVSRKRKKKRPSNLAEEQVQVTKTEQQPEIHLEVKSSLQYCSVCKREFKNLDAINQHKSSVRHRRMEKLGIIQAALGKKQDRSANKFSMAVTSDPEDIEGEIEVVASLGEAKQIVLTVTNTDEDNGRVCTLVDVTMVWSTVFFDDKELREVKRVGFEPGHSVSYTVECKARKELGYSYVPVVFSFHVDEPDETGETCIEAFHIVRYLRMRAVSDMYDDLKVTKVYTKPDKPVRVPYGVKTVPGLKLQSNRDGLRLQMERTKDYFIPVELRRELWERNFSVATRSLLENGLSFLNYGQRLPMLLHAEEFQMEKDIRDFDMREVTFKKEGKLLSLEVPGLAENRPSLLRGDRLFASEHRKGANVNPNGDEGGSWSGEAMPRVKRYEGIVHEVQQLKVKLGFSNEMPFIDKKKFDVQFTFNRLPLRMMHRACEQAASSLKTGNVLFPDTDIEIGKLKNDVTIKSFYDRDLNDEQKVAVENIVRGTSRPAPYIVFGPPGTGKTVTIVEAIKQVCKLLDGAVILACAPENSAADLLTERLLAHIDKGKILRMYASSRSWNCIPEKLKDARVVNFDPVSHQVFYPSKDEIIDQYRVVVTTLITAGRLVSAKFNRGHFTHVFIDEAGHAVEPESLIPIAGLLDPGQGPYHEGDWQRHGQLVLAGDPKQLGPVVRSQFAKGKDTYKDDDGERKVNKESISGLEMSLLERLMNLKVYSKCQISYEKVDDVVEAFLSYNNMVITKLVNNYRSHIDIIEVPNQLFYDNEMVECAGDFRKIMLGWEELPNKDFPIIFHPVFGADEREERSPSFFNVAEVETVELYLSKLLDEKVRSKGLKMIKPQMIGIIAPYRKQVHKIKKMIEKRRFGDIKVGSVEEFQGQERCIIIISSVRSPNQEYINLDKKHGLGFVDNPKRFNVAITRAQALLILIGNPELLTMDDNWQELLQFCYDNNGDVNHTPRDKVSAIVNTLITKFQRTLKIITGSGNTDKDEDEEDEHENPEWTRHD